MRDNTRTNPSHLVDVLSKISLLRTERDGITIKPEAQRAFENIRNHPEEVATQIADGPSFLEELSANERGLDFCAWHTLAAGYDKYEILTPVEKIKSLVLLDLLSEGMPNSSGSPDGFLTIRGDQLEPVTRMFGVSLLYVWLEECNPCETVKADLENIYSDIPRDVALLAIDGQANDEQLMNEYDLVGAPTILIFLDTKVDVRLVGPYPLESVKQEIERTRKKIN